MVPKCHIRWLFGLRVPTSVRKRKCKFLGLVQISTQSSPTVSSVIRIYIVCPLKKCKSQYFLVFSRSLFFSPFVKIYFTNKDEFR